MGEAVQFPDVTLGPSGFGGLTIGFGCGADGELALGCMNEKGGLRTR